MKKFFSLIAIASLGLSALVACNPEEKPGEQKEENPSVETQEIDLTANPMGNTGRDALYVTLELGEEVIWQISSDEDYSEWISYSPKKGIGETDVKFEIVGNNTGKDRAATFLVNVGEDIYYEIFIAQAKAEIAVRPGDLAFLQAIVEGQCLGDDTPEITDWYTFDGAGFPGIELVRSDVDNMFYIKKFSGAPFVSFPETLDLENLEEICMRASIKVREVTLPKVWNTPKLNHCELANNNLVGTLPEGFGNMPEVRIMFMDYNDLCGALPHDWNTPQMEICIFTNNMTHRFNEEGLPAHNSETNTGFGYLIPKGFDVIMNEDRTWQNDPTQLKMGGGCSGNFEGFEKGWGQARYERFDADAVAGDETIWSDYRLLCGDQSGLRDWATEPQYWDPMFSNLGYIDDPAAGKKYCQCIPAVLKEWNQEEADAYTAQILEDRGL